MDDSLLPADDLGELGESQFKVLADKAGFISNKAIRDRGGWDYHVEFLAENRPHTTLDDRQGLVSSYVQVKTTYRSAKPRIRLRLSAAEFLAKRPGPSFIVAIVYSRENVDDFDVYVVELIGPRLASVLKALRQRQRAGRRQINQTYISFDLKAGERLPEPTGPALRQRFLVAFAEGEEKYIQSKRSERKTAGYGTSRHQARITLHDVTISDAVEVFLGNRDCIATIDRVIETRFGIDLPSGAIPTGEALIKIVPEPVGECQVKIRAAGLKRPIVREGRFFHASLPGPSGLVWKSRFSFDFFDVIQDAEIFQLKTKAFEYEQKAVLFSDAISNYRMLSALRNGQADFELRIKDSDKIFRWRLNGNGKSSEDVEDRIQLFDAARRISEELGFSAEHIMPADVYANQKSIYATAAMSLEGGRSVRIGFETKREIDEDFSRRRLLSQYFDLGKFRIAYAADVTLAQLDPDNPKMWFTQKHKPVALELIGKSADDYRDFLDCASESSGITEKLLDSPDADFVNAALGDCEPF